MVINYYFDLINAFNELIGQN